MMSQFWLEHYHLLGCRPQFIKNTASFLWQLLTVNREILVMVLVWPILAPKYEVPKLNTPKYVTLQKLTAKIEHCHNIFLYLYSLICTFLSYFFPK